MPSSLPSSWLMLLVPVIFDRAYLYRAAYMRRLNPVTRLQRTHFGKLNAG
jgi:hypothetical protein